MRLRLGLILALALAPLLLFSLWQSWYDFKRDQVQRTALLEDAAQLAVEDVLNTIDNSRRILSVTASLVDLDSCTADLQAIMDSFPAIYNLAIGGPEGGIICSARPVRRDLPNDYPGDRITPESPYFSELLGPTPDQIGLERSLVFSFGVFEDGKRVRTVYSSYDVKVLRALKDRSVLPLDVKVLILSRDGEVLVGTGEDRIHYAADQWAALLDSGQRKDIRTHERDGEPRLLSIYETSETDLFVAVDAPPHNVFSWNRINPLASAIVPVAAWILGFLAIWLAFDGLILSRLRQMRRRMQSYARGNRMARVPVTETGQGNAIDALGTTFNELVERMNEREETIVHSLAEKELLLREIHHRVKNNLQVITSLLNMQKRRVKDPTYAQAIDDTRNRILAISQVHKSLYEGDDMSRVDMAPFIKSLAKQLGRALALDETSVIARTHVQAAPRDADQTTPIALFIVEAMTNAAKHGLAQGGIIDITLRDGDDGMTLLEIRDDGIGADAASRADRDSSTALQTGTGAGSKLMAGFARQLGGTYTVEDVPTGYVCRMSFPKR